MAESQREKTEEIEEYDLYEMALARLMSIQSEHEKKIQDAKATFESNRTSRQEDIQERQREIQLLQQELQKKANELKEKEMELQYEEDKFRAFAKSQHRERKRRLEPYLRASPAPIMPPTRESTETTRGRTEATSARQEPDLTELRVGDPSIIDLQDVSSDSGSTVPPSLASALSPNKRPRISEVESSDIDPSPGRNGKRQRLRVGYRSEAGEGSNTAQLRGSQSEAQATTPAINPSHLPTEKQGKGIVKNRNGFKGVVNPTAGGIYKVVQSPRKGEYAAVLLPLGDFSAIGISKSIYDTTLRRFIPVCYIHNKESKEILGWKKDYDDGGVKVTNRKFPVMSLESIARDRIPLDGEFSPDGAKYSWVPARSIRTFDLDATISRMTPGGRREDDRDSLLTLSVTHEEPAGQVPKIEQEDARNSQTPEQSQVLTLRYSEADQDPRQARTVEEHDDTIHANIEPRSKSQSQRTRPEFPSFESIYRETSEPELAGSETYSNGIPNDDDRDTQVLNGLFLGSPLAQIGETSDDNPTSDTQYSAPIRVPRCTAKIRSNSELPYVARAIRRPWMGDDSNGANNQDGFPSERPESTSSITVHTSTRGSSNQHENNEVGHSPPTSQMLSQGSSQGHPITIEPQSNRACNEEPAPRPDPNIRSIASMALGMNIMWDAHY
ncbi:hypothetical protein F5Y11DRAFT_345702 [Daldinia sp. FL1419]|nr:hypothetical protein F5Y11DRAFT_345702 [Daldinia sp. FL1419]